MSITPATLWVVATPIGNLEDIGRRAQRLLSEVALVAAEDTRHSRRLTEPLGIDTPPMISLHEHNETRRVASILARLDNGEDVALISDAGTPLISDPGFELVRAAREAGYRVLAVPGPCAAVAALSVAGLPSDRFVFEGFLPAKRTARRSRLQSLCKEPRTLIFYEAGHRIEGAVADIVEVFGATRAMSLSREISKLHEQTRAGPARDIGTWLAADDNHRRGEFVLVIAGAVVEPTPETAIDLDALLKELLALTGTKQAAKAAARLTGGAVNDIYPRAVAIQQDHV